jgi:hypothetical protein
MGMYISIEPLAGAQIVVRVSGPYNPDILEDMTNRAIRLIGEVVAKASEGTPDE